MCTGGSQCCRPNEKCDPSTDTCVKCDDRDTICDGECCGQGHVCVSVGTQEICCATETVCGTDENRGCCDYSTFCDKTDPANPVCKACPGDAPLCGGSCCVKGQECIKDKGICCDPDRRCGKDNNDCCHDGETCCKGDKTTCISGADKKCCNNKLICSSDKKCCDDDNKECVAGVCCTPERKCENGTVCCSENQICVNETCCTPERKCPDPKDPSGKKNICCATNSICNGKDCVPLCGKDIYGKDFSCKKGEICFSADELSDSQKTKFKHDFGADNVRVNGGTAYVCTSPPTCKFGDSESAPNSINGIYTCTDIFNQTDESKGIAYCSSKDDASKASECWQKSLTDCTNPCTVQYPLKQDYTKTNDDIHHIKSNPTDGTYLGNYCGSGEGWQYLTQYSGSKCGPQDCWRLLGKDGVIDMNWDEDHKLCTSITECKTEQPKEFTVSTACTDKGPDNLCDYPRECSKGRVFEPPPPLFYRVEQSPSKHDCTTTSSTCENPGKSICSGSPEPCGQGEAGCYATKEQCNDKNKCYEGTGWFKNSEGTDCNIFACTTDGSVMNKSIPAGTLAPKNADSLYDYASGTCWRKGPGLNPDDKSYCSGSPAFSCSRNDPSGNVNKDWGNWNCNYAGLGHCEASMNDNTPIIKPASGAPKYKYANYDAPFQSIGARICWFDDRSWGKTINFDKVRYPAPGHQSYGC